MRDICFVKFGKTAKTGNCLNSTTRLSWYIDVTEAYEYCLFSVLFWSLCSSARLYVSTLAGM
jgi:hypothetical protein